MHSLQHFLPVSSSCQQTWTHQSTTHVECPQQHVHQAHTHDDVSLALPTRQMLALRLAAIRVLSCAGSGVAGGHGQSGA